MKKLITAAFLVLFLFSLSCSSTPAGTEKIKDLVANGQSRIGQKVTVVGESETRTGYSTEKMFKIFNGTDSIWVVRNEETDEPPQATKVRVEGTLQQKEIKTLGKVLYIEATSVTME